MTVVPRGRGGSHPGWELATATPLVRVLTLAVILVGCTLAQLAGPVPASAHNSLVSSTPADGANLRQAPTAVTLTFDQPVGRRFGVVAVTGPRGEKVQAGALEVSGAKATQPLRTLNLPGTYQVAWRVVSVDGHPITGTFRFRLQKGAAGLAPSPADSATPSTAAPSATDPPTDSLTDPPTDTPAPSGTATTRASGGGSRWPIIVGGLALIPLIAVGVVLAVRRSPTSPDSGAHG
ncbi:copper resistance protein CopC [Actinopolymorpha sp. B11F2]|uniref:copper resistance CopC family protein n=1 Tax=Actinopolymorpha sp. B11F2 TaxID=3160862 RepID=UPI0032E4D001